MVVIEHEHHDDNSSNGLLVGVLVVIVIILLFLVFRGGLAGQKSVEQVQVPNQQTTNPPSGSSQDTNTDVNVQIPTGGTVSSTPAVTSSPSVTAKPGININY